MKPGSLKEEKKSFLLSFDIGLLKNLPRKEFITHPLKLTTLQPVLFELFSLSLQEIPTKNFFYMFRSDQMQKNSVSLEAQALN